MIQKILIVYNPKAGKKYPANYQAVFLRQLKKYVPDANCQWHETLPDFPRELEKIDFTDFCKIIVIGGDGTIKKTAEFILKNNLTIPLAIIPQGSANVLANSLNIPLRQSASIKLAALGHEKTIDVGLLNNEHYFLVGLSIGLLSKVVLTTRAKAKNRWGILAYLFTLLKSKTNEHDVFDFWCDGQKFHLVGNTLLITNTFSLLKIKPRNFSDYTDGWLEVMVTKNSSVWSFFMIAFFSWLNKKFIPYLFWHKAKQIKIEASCLAGKIIQLDGEEVRVNKIEAEILPQRLKVIISK
ncbi:MAG: diacylglycerol kinase family protein [Patescibacteria group bacterium]|jgi:diacylglycerol kinase family enzyme